MSRIAVVATLKAAEGKEAELEAALTGMVGNVEAEEGTLVYALSRQADAPGTFVFFELYRDSDALQAHSTSDAMKELGPKLAGLLGGRPEIVRLEPLGGKGLPG